MRRLIIRDHRGHVTMDLDTEEAIQELERQMNQGMLAVASTGEAAVQLLSPTDPVVRQADEVRVMWPLQGGALPGIRRSLGGERSPMISC